MAEEPEWVAERRQAKATQVVEFLLHGDPMCRYCQLPIRADAWGEWSDGQSRSRWCKAPGFVESKVQVPHRPWTWTATSLANTTRAERERIRKAAGVERPCSEKTWAEVVRLFEHLHHEDPERRA